MRYINYTLLIAMAIASSCFAGTKAVDINQLLKKEPVFWGRVGWAYNPPRVDQNGKVVMMVNDDLPEQKFYSDLANKVGIKVFSSILFSGWVAPHKFDYTAVDETLEKIFSQIGEDCLYIPRIKLDVPPSWCAENPQDTTVYYPAENLSESEIVELVGTPAHDWAGMEWDGGYNAYGNKRDRRDDRPNVHGLIGLQSFSSEKWLRDAGEALRNIIKHIENGKYGKRIVAYHIAYGQTGETTIWRGWEKNDYRFGDYGLANRRAFYDWGIKQYGSREKLAAAWGQPEISRENVKLPTPMKRELHWSNTSEFFRADSGNLICMDYERFSSDINVKAISHFARIVKEETGKGVGAFYGYYLAIPRSAYAGHLGYEKLLENPDVDFLASPKGYQYFAADTAGSLQCPPMTINLKKLFVSEIDPPPHIIPRRSPSKNIDDTRTVLRREFVSCMQSQSGYWYMDLGGGWLDSPEILQTIKDNEAAGKLLRAQKAEPVSEVLVVSDSESFYYSKPHWLLHKDILKASVQQIRLAGAPVDHYRLSDLEDIDLSKYKAVFFMNTIRIADEQWAKIEQKLRKDAVLVWHHAPAVWGDSYNPAHSAKITGFELSERKTAPTETVVFTDNKKTFVKKFVGGETVQFFRPFPNPEKPYPLFSVRANATTEILAKYEDGAGAVAKNSHNGRTNYFVSLPVLDTKTYREIIGESKAFMPAPEGCAVYADSRFIGFFPSKDSHIDALPKGDWRDMFGTAKYSGGDGVDLNARRAFILINEK